MFGLYWAGKVITRYFTHFDPTQIYPRKFWADWGRDPFLVLTCFDPPKFDPTRPFATSSPIMEIDIV